VEDVGSGCHERDRVVSKLDGSTRVKLQYDPTALALEQRLSRASRSSGARRQQVGGRRRYKSLWMVIQR
jgi:hypothetical protein